MLWNFKGFVEINNKLWFLKDSSSWSYKHHSCFYQMPRYQHSRDIITWISDVFYIITFTPKFANRASVSCSRTLWRAAEDLNQQPSSYWTTPFCVDVNMLFFSSDMFYMFSFYLFQYFFFILLNFLYFNYVFLTSSYCFCEFWGLTFLRNSFWVWDQKKARTHPL